MKPTIVVVDASVLVACPIKDSRAREVLLNHPEVQFVAPGFVLDELAASRARLESRFRVQPAAFDAVMAEIRQRVQIVAARAYAFHRHEAQRRARKARAGGDDEYVALALALEAPIWTYDDDFDRIQGVRRVTAAQIEEESRIAPISDSLLRLGKVDREEHPGASSASLSQLAQHGERLLRQPFVIRHGTKGFAKVHTLRHPPFPLASNF